MMGSSTTYEGADPQMRFTTASAPSNATVRCLICGWELTGATPSDVQPAADEHVATHTDPEAIP